MNLTLSFARCKGPAELGDRLSQRPRRRFVTVRRQMRIESVEIIHGIARADHSDIRPVAALRLQLVEEFRV